jgi:prefoldin subunit 5
MTILTDHSINGVIQQILSYADDQRVEERRSALSPELQAGFGRVFTFARLMKDLLEKSAPEEVSLNGLNAVGSNLQQVSSDLSVFMATGNQGNLTGALSALDNAANIFAWTFYNRPVRGAKPQFESVESVRRAAEKAIQSIEDRTAGLESSITAAASQLQGQDERVTQLSATLEEVRSNSTAAVAAIQQQFSENLSGYRSEIDDLKEKFRKSQQELSNGATAEAETLLQELRSQKDKAAEIVQIVGNIGVTGNYQNRAAQERTQANFWRWVTVILFTVGVVLVTVNLVLNFKGSIDMTALIARFAIAVSVALPALYTARESARHRTNADRAKQTELELASLGPFLETLPEPQRDQIISELAKSYFGRSIDPHEVKSPITVEEVRKIIAATADLAGKVRGG